MAKRQKSLRKPSTSHSQKEFSMPSKLVEDELERSMQAVRNFQFLLACILHQSGGLLEVREETMEYVKSRSSLDFIDQYDKLRKVYVFRVKFGEAIKDVKVNEGAETRNPPDAEEAQLPSDS